MSEPDGLGGSAGPTRHGDAAAFPPQSQRILSGLVSQSAAVRDVAEVRVGRGEWFRLRLGVPVG
jgi:hypothetical protein